MVTGRQFTPGGFEGRKAGCSAGPATKVELLLNLKAAKSLGLTFPLTLLGRADVAARLAFCNAAKPGSGQTTTPPSGLLCQLLPAADMASRVMMLWAAAESPIGCLIRLRLVL